MAKNRLLRPWRDRRKRRYDNTATLEDEDIGVSATYLVNVPDDRFVVLVQKNDLKMGRVVPDKTRREGK